MKLGRPFPSPTADVGLLLTRVLIGTVLIAHGWQKFATYTLDGTAQSFEAMGVPVAQAAATFAALVELVGGALLLLGLLTPVAAALVVVDMVGAFWFAHRSSGVFVDQGGWELVAVVSASAIALAVAGPGRASIDHAIGGRVRAEA
ncbi:DoxX family protein [Nocardioides panzhihuensis]|uniref:Putative oxidoreductase n=1 Tax=Nocardioides panzhihuensis TaxID=860243 RepID=A0A7Z0DKC7_9ACTN|nr:DoxX family protein [Nocardioides panzhihuensis]NYI76963.1 putative oxidoreductase [Nocardioides panzhihuensis]